MSLSNNPFALSAESRFPDIQQQQHQPQQQQYQQQQQQPQQGGYGYSQAQSGYGYGQQQPQALYAQPTGYAPQSGGFQPSSQFGQALQQNGSQLNFGIGGNTSLLQGYTGGPPGSSAYYAPSPQPQPLNHQLVADLDPFSGQQQRQQQQQQQQAGSSGQNGPMYGGGQGGQQYNTTQQQQEDRQQEQYGEHPRTFMKNNKASLEQWNQQAWGRARALFAQLEKAWEGRKKLVAEWQTWNLGYDDRATVDKLRKEADENIDMVAAYTLQIKEVFESYRHSTDNFSRNQVRQAMNQGLQTLPDWPLVLQPPPRLPDGQASSQSTSLFDNLPSGPPSQYPQSQQQQQTGYYGQQPQPQPNFRPQQQQQQQPQYQQQQPMYAQQTGYPQQAQQQVPAQTGYGYGYQQPQQQQQMMYSEQQFRQW